MREVGKRNPLGVVELWFALVGAVCSFALSLLALDPAPEKIGIGFLGASLGFGVAVAIVYFSRRRNPPSVFISVSTMDAEFAQRLCMDLWQLNIVAKPVVDILENRLVCGLDLGGRAFDTIKGVDFYLPVCSKNFAAWELGQRELEIAISLKKRIVPIVISEDSVPWMLRHRPCANFTFDYRSGFLQLLRNLQKVDSR